MSSSMDDYDKLKLNSLNISMQCFIFVYEIEIIPLRWMSIHVVINIWLSLYDEHSRAFLDSSKCSHRYNNVIMGAMASQITSLTIVYSTINPGEDKKKTSKFRVTGLCEGNSPSPVNSPHKGPVTLKMFPFDDVIMIGSFTIRNPFLLCNGRVVMMSTMSSRVAPKDIALTTLPPKLASYGILVFS